MNEVNTNTTITMENTNEASFIDNKIMRDENIERIEVLDKVKELFLIPAMEMMTIRQVAEYYEVDYNTVKQCYSRNRDELILDGVVNKTPTDFKEIFKGTACTFKDLKQVHGKVIVQLDDNVTLEIPNRGICTFPKRAVLRMGMLLQDSKIAKEVRTQLLNAVEKVEPEVLVEDINSEQELLMNIVKAYADGNTTEMLLASQQLDQFRKRHITNLNNKIEEDKPLVEFANHVTNSEGVLDMAAFAKILDNKGVHIGRNRFFRWLRDNGYLRPNNEPYQKFVTDGILTAREYVYYDRYNNSHTGVKTYITGKGQKYFYEKLKDILFEKE